MTKFHTITWLDDGDICQMLDQRKLPHEVVYNDYTSYQEVADAIRVMVIRGAPAIGAAAGYGMALVCVHTAQTDVAGLRAELKTAAEVLRQARPTAVNLFWGIDRMLTVLSDPALDSIEKMQETAVAEAKAIAAEDVEINKQMGVNALELVPQEATCIHHCNTGSLATVDYGTALGVIRTAHEHGRNINVIVDETRPRLQGGRLTAWELQQQGIPFKVIADGASGHFLRKGDVDFCVVGTDRVAANGDVANKIGTYNLAVVAHENGVPFYVACPTSTIDMKTPTGDEIEIEERPAAEVTHVGTWQITPDGIDVGNPAFDVTPHKYVTAIITEKGVVYPPYQENIAKMMAR
ncbi:MAG: S-methyl-5-thioribose-1-phosphate isomerase [Chloroflexi bacterium]|nr:MAG: S-methyl-5-thioribose-1-phosphate isomerase [Chloroflexota bacterium]